ncbi:DNA mismatch repair protein MutS [bacterium]|nr:DNA mismatch repair protein MutS [bacterium]
MPDPRLQYNQRLLDRQSRAQQLDVLHYRLANGRLLAFACIVISVFVAVARPAGTGLLLLSGLAFAILLLWHRRVQTRWDRANRAVGFYQEGLHRLDGTWIGRGLQGADYLDPQHPYLRDLDIFGKGSLFEYLCIARTRPGQDRLANWLASGASPDQIGERQEAVCELVDCLDLREDLATLYAGRHTLSAPVIAAWGQAPLRLTSNGMRLLAALLGLSGVATLVYWLASWDPRPLAIVVLVQQLFKSWPGRELGCVLRDVEPIRRDICNLSAFLARLQQESFHRPLLVRLWEPLRHSPPSQALAELEGLIEMLDARRNHFISPLVFVSLSTLQLACQVERWRGRYGKHVEAWMESMAQFEALSCLAGFAWENPGYCWPQVSLSANGVQAEGLGHPLLGPECVVNDLALGEVSVWIVSGSNMAGKSSLLRALGSNVVLAMAGGPVRARSFLLEPLCPGASIQLADSLVGGISRFYAEILRLRQIVEMAQAKPRLLFLLDEIMGGTNSHDRRIGAEAVVRSLVHKGALGLVTTHDLALTAIVDDLPGQAGNVHFEDQLEEGTMSFDYHLRPGPVTRSNALQLMRAVGLEV